MFWIVFWFSVFAIIEASEGKSKGRSVKGDFYTNWN